MATEAILSRPNPVSAEGLNAPSGKADYTNAELAQLSYFQADNQDRHPLLGGLKDKLKPHMVTLGRAMTAAGALFGVNHATASAADFQLGFKVIHDQIPAIVGNAVDDESHNPQNGDGLQHSTGGLLVWRKADNWTAFTDGFRTWVNGPNGLQQRLNTQRFSFEANPDNLSIVGGSPATKPAGGPSEAEIATLQDPVRKRAGDNLQSLVDAKDPNVYPFTTNPFGLDSNEVAAYRNTGADTFSTFRVRNGIIIATSQKGPFPEIQGLKANAGPVEAALKLGQDIDPNFSNMLAGNGLKIIAGSVGLFRTHIYDSAVDNKTGGIFINEATVADVRSAPRMLSIIVAESFLIDNENNGPVLNTNIGIDKETRAKNWADQNKGRMSSAVYNEVTANIQNGLNAYITTPSLAPTMPLRG